MLLWSLTHLIEKEIRKKGGKQGSRSRIDFEKMEAKHAAFVDIFFCPYLLQKSHPQWRAWCILWLYYVNVIHYIIYYIIISYYIIGFCVLLSDIQHDSIMLLLYIKLYHIRSHYVISYSFIFYFHIILFSVKSLLSKKILFSTISCRNIFVTRRR